MVKKTKPRAKPSARVSTEDKIAAAVASALAAYAPKPTSPPAPPVPDQMNSVPPPQEGKKADKIRVTGLWKGRGDSLSGRLQNNDEVIAYLQKHKEVRAVIYPNGYSKGQRDATDILYFYPADDKKGGMQYSRAAGGQGYPPRDDGGNNKPIRTDDKDQNARF